MNIVKLSENDKSFLSKAVVEAHIDDKDLSFSFGESSSGQYVQVKVGQGMWSAPLYGVE